ncbi:MAG TPA: hypothetical protein VGG39_33720 [Polyangiaceae bacterium]|jgi:hypothetical protein
MRALLASLVLLATLAVALPAAANAPAPWVRAPARLGGAFVVKPTTLVVEHEALTFTCPGQGLRCTFEARYRVRNDGAEREEVLGAFYGIASQQVSVRSRGVDLRRTLTPEQLAVTDEAVFALDPELRRQYATSLDRTGFAFAVDGHAREELVFEGTTEAVYLERNDSGMEFVLPPLFTRHPWLATEERYEAAVEFAYALSPIRSWSGSPSIDVTVRHSPSLAWKPGDLAWAHSREGGEAVERTTIASASASTLRFGFIRPGTTVLNGGPLVGAGGRLDTKELRVRLGYEVGGPWWAIYSAAVETSFHGRTTIIPAVEAALPDILVLVPSLAVGAGVPTQLRDGKPAIVGVRGQFTMSFPIVSMVVPVDFFPGAVGDNRWQVSMLAQASF